MSLCGSHGRTELLLQCVVTCWSDEKFSLSFRLSFKRREGSSKKKKKEKLLEEQQQQQQQQQLLQPEAAASETGPLPAKFIRATTVKPNTLSPIWNERFRL